MSGTYCIGGGEGRTCTCKAYVPGTPLSPYHDRTLCETCGHFPGNHVTPAEAPAPPAAIETHKLRDILNTAGHALENGQVNTALEVLNLVPPVGSLAAVLLKNVLPIAGKALADITAPETTLEEVAAAMAKTHRVEDVDVAGALGQ